MFSILSTRHLGVRLYFMCCWTLSLTFCYFFLKLATNTGYCRHIIFLPLNLCLILQLFIYYLFTGWLTRCLIPLSRILEWKALDLKPPELILNERLALNSIHSTYCTYCTQTLLSSYLSSFSAPCTILYTSRTFRILVANDVNANQHNLTSLNVTL